MKNQSSRLTQDLYSSFWPAQTKNLKKYEKLQSQSTTGVYSRLIGVYSNGNVLQF